MRCEFTTVAEDGQYECRRCKSRVLMQTTIKECGTYFNQNEYLQRREERPIKTCGGPGTELSSLLKEKFNFTPCGSCAALAQRMDRMGADWCRENIDDIAVEIDDNRKTHQAILSKLSSLAPRTTRLNYIRKLVIEACDRAVEKSD